MIDITINSIYLRVFREFLFGDNKYKILHCKNLYLNSGNVLKILQYDYSVNSIMIIF